MSRMTKLDLETESEIYTYVRGMHLSPVYWEYDVIPAGSPDIKRWLKTKTDFEGAPPDKLLVEIIGGEGEIRRPVILDLDNNVCAEGRHRLAAAAKFKLDVPIVMISSTKTPGSKKLKGT